MTFAFLFLTYDNFTCMDVIMKFINNQNVYIHPKFPNKVNNNLKKYIINNLVETSWGDFSIVQATLNLLEESYKNNNNEWFVLLSQDCYPLYSFSKFERKFNKLHNNKSIFSFVEKKNNYYKSSQWWILKRDDVKIILENQNKYNNYFKNMNKNIVKDEIYFLSVLKLENSKYEFTDLSIMYVKWLNNIIQQHPFTINRLLKYDYNIINKNNSLFVRKITSSFNPNQYNNKKKLLVICIGTETKEQLIPNDKSYDIIIILLVNNINFVKKELIEKALQIIFIHYTLVKDVVKYIYTNEMFKSYNEIIITSETFNYNNNLKLNNDIIYDENKNSAIYIKNKK